MEKYRSREVVEALRFEAPAQGPNVTAATKAEMQALCPEMVSVVGGAPLPGAGGGRSPFQFRVGEARVRDGDYIVPDETVVGYHVVSGVEFESRYEALPIGG